MPSDPCYRAIVTHSAMKQGLDKWVKSLSKSELRNIYGLKSPKKSKRRRSRKSGRSRKSRSRKGRK